MPWSVHKNQVENNGRYLKPSETELKNSKVYPFRVRLVT